MPQSHQILQNLTLPENTWSQPCLIATFGFPGAGKTSIATEISQRYPMVCLSTDAIRLKYHFSSGPETLVAMKMVAELLFASGHSLIFDGIHMMRQNRDELRQFGRENNVQVRFVHVVAAPDVIQERLNQRAADPDATAKAGKFVITNEHFQRIISYFESPDGEHDVIEVDTSPSAKPTEIQLKSLYDALDGWFKDS